MEKLYLTGGFSTLNTLHFASSAFSVNEGQHQNPVKNLAVLITLTHSTQVIFHFWRAVTKVALVCVRIILFVICEPVSVSNHVGQDILKL